MKHTEICLFAACLALAACNKSLAPAAMPEPETPSADVNLNIVTEGAGATRSADTAHLDFERYVNDFDLKVFRGGFINHTYSQSGTSPFSLKLLAGNLSFHAFANVPDSIFEGVSTESALDDALLPFSQANSTTALAMCCTVSKAVMPGQDNSVSLELERMVSRISLQGVQSALPEVLGTFTLQSAYLADIPSHCHMDMTADNSQLLNPIATPLTSASASAAGGLTWQSSATAPSVSAPWRLYCYPGNQVKLILVAKVGSTTTYYTIPMGNLVHNKSYSVNALITNMGTSTPDPDPVSHNVSASISVADWVQGAEINETI